MFGDMELIGIPHRLVFSERGLDGNSLEYKGRTDAGSTDIDLNNAVAFIQERMAANCPAGPTVADRITYFSPLGCRHGADDGLGKYFDGVLRAEFRSI